MATSTPPPLLRKGLIDLVSRASGLVIFSAPTGFGKSIVAAQLAANTEPYDSVTTVSPEQLNAGTRAISDPDGGGTHLVIVDELDANELAQVDNIDVRAGCTLVCLTREQPTAAQSRSVDVTYFNHLDLRFSETEIAELSSDILGQDKAESLALILESMTDGWPEHVIAVLSALSPQDYHGESAQLVMYDGPHLEELISRCLADLEPTYIDGLEQLAHLTTFSPGAANAFTPGLLAEANRVGFPLLHRPGGAIEMPALMRAHLKRRTEFRPESARLIAPILVATLGVPETLGALLSAKAASAAASIVCQISPDQLAATNQINMLGILRAVEAAEPYNPLLKLRRADVHQNLAQLGAERNAILDALQIARRVGNAEAEFAAEVALLRTDLRSIEKDEAEERLSSLEQISIAPTSSPVGISLRELRALVTEQQADLQSIYKSIELLAELASEWEYLGDRARSARLLRMMAVGPLNTIGDYTEARAALDRAAKLVWDSPVGMAVTSQLLCRFLALSGDTDRLASEERRATGLIAAVDLRWMSGYLDWALMHACIWKGGATAAERAHYRAVSRLGELANDDTGVIFYAESAAVMAVLGSDELAHQCLAKSLELASEDHIEVAVASIVVAARCGDAKTVRKMIAKLRSSGMLPHERAWRIELEQLVANQRLGAPDAELPEALNVISESCEQLSLVPLMETLLADVAVKTNAEASAESTDLQEVNVELLGGFSVTVNGEELSVPPGHVTQLLKVLAVRGEPLAVESVVGKLWPDADLTLGKRRLKNVVSRLRNTVDVPVIKRSGDRISLADNVATDLATFRTVAGNATRPNTGRGLGSCIEALNTYKGHMLPTDLYDDDFTRERDALRAVALSVLGIALDHAPDGSVAPAWLLQTAIRLEPDSEQPFLRIAEIADSVDGLECAAAARSQAKSLAESLGIFYDPGAPDQR